MNPLSRSIVGGLGLVASIAPISHAEDAVDPAKTEIAELRQQVQDLTKLVKDLQLQVEAKAPPAAPAPAPVLPEIPPIAPVPAAPAAAVTPPELPPELPLDPLPAPKRTDSSIFNPEISAAIDAIGSYSSSADNANFTVRDIEIMVQANVDQLAHAYLVANAESELDPWTKTDVFSEVSLGIEEAAIETTSLPYGLSLKAGQFFADFSRLGKVHSHELPSTDRPASLDGIIGGETKARGVEVSWIPQIDHYLRLTFGAVDGIGAETSATGVMTTLSGDEDELFAGSNRRSFSDIMVYGRAATIFELGDQTSLNVGLDYAHGEDRGTRELASADFKLTWQPDAASFDRLEVGGEVLHGKTEGAFGPSALFAGGPSRGVSSADGAYLYAQYRIGKNWEPGIRYDWFRPESWSQTDADSNGIADGLARGFNAQSSISAYLNYNFSEYSRLRLGVSHIDGASGAFNGKDDDWLGFIQWTITLGPHKHAFQP